MPKILPSDMHPKSLELLKLVRDPASKIAAYTFYKNLDETESRQVALELHGNLEIVYYQQDTLQNAINKTHEKAMQTFEVLLQKFAKYVNTPLGIQIATDIRDMYDINLFDKNHNNMILIATAAGNVALVKTLLQVGADPTIESSTSHSSAWIFLLEKLANTSKSKLASNYEEIFNFYIEHGINPLCGNTLSYVKKLNNPYLNKSFENMPAVRFINDLYDEIKKYQFKVDSITILAAKYGIRSEQIGQLLNARDKNGRTLLMTAIANQNQLAIKRLLDYKIDVNVTDPDGNTAMHIACLAEKSVRFDIAMPLVRYRNKDNPEYEANLFIKNKQRLTALAMEPSLKELIFVHNINYYYAYSFVDNIQSKDTIKANRQLLAFINGSQKINLYDLFNFLETSRDHSVILACASSGNLEILQFLVTSGIIDKDILQQQLSKALCIAVQYNYLNITEFIYSQGINIDTQGDYGLTPLQLAASENAKDCVKFLLSKGADSTIKNDMGNNALDIALVHGHHEVAKLLNKGDLKAVGYTDLMLAILNKDVAGAFKQIESNPEKINNVTHGGFDALMIAAMTYDAELKATGDFFNLILTLAAKSDAFRINKKKFNFIQLFKYSFIDIMEELYHSFSTPESIKAHNGKNFLHLCAILGSDFSHLYEFEINATELDSFINALDEDGNSPLSYVLFNTAYKIDPQTVLDMVAHGAKFIRNNIEVKQSQHIKAMLAADKKLPLSPQETANINMTDQDGRNVLHIACMRNKMHMALGLIEDKVQIHQRDNYGRTPLHYAAQHNSIFQFGLDVQFNTRAWDEPDNLGITPLVIALQVADADSLQKLQKVAQDCESYINKILSGFYDISSLDDIDAKIKIILGDKNLDHLQKLALVAALRNFINRIELKTDSKNVAEREALITIFKDSKRFDTAMREIMKQEFKNTNRYDIGPMPDGCAIGLELEIPGLISHTFIPTKALSSLYPVNFTRDSTVENALLSSNVVPSEGAKLELVSDVINNYTRYAQFMDLCMVLKSSGSTVNASSGMHVHFNCRGTDISHPPLARFVPEAQELDYLKYVALNYIRVENLLRGFMRNGALYNLYGSAYVKSLGEYEDDIRNCSSVTELQDICTHSNTLDFTALNRHGTIEFRIHDGTANPILINAWVDCLSRLVFASRTQAAQHITGQPYNTLPNIEELVTLLIAMRHYNTTWDPKWAAFEGSETITTSAYPGKDKSPIQIQIQESPLYRLAHMFIYYDKDETKDAKTRITEFLDAPENDKFFAPGNFEKNRVLIDLKDLLTFTRDNPGLFENSPDIDPAIQAIDSLLHPTLKP